jgi:TnpA family transposase
LLITGVETLNASYNPHYGFEKGVTMYSAVSDQYSRFGVGVINTNSRDAIHVVDMLLNHNTELEIEEHYTDTAGHTDQVFGLTHLLGFRFAPRLRDISKQQKLKIHFQFLKGACRLSDIVSGANNIC